jgi:hypothetical protein
LYASLTFFPASNSNITSCVAADYATPDLNRVDLSSAAAASLGQRIDQVSPKGDTPTRPAIQGAIIQAQALRAAHPNEKTVIVFATDGEPWQCGATTGPTRAQAIADAANDARAVAGDIKTYVIGVGPSVAALNEIAVAGGTGSAILVSAGQPNRTRDELVTALGQIRANSISCDVTIPAPPDGRTLDVNKIDVSLAGVALAYSQDCADPKGWHFDSVASPTKVQLCTDSCGSVQRAGGNLSVSFACTDVRIIR